MKKFKEENSCKSKRAEHYNSADTNDKLIINLKDLGHIMRFQYEGKASQKRILIILNETGKITQRELTERLGIQPGSASEIIAKLENSGFITRTQNEDDRRTTDICLTGEGRELAAQAAQQRRSRHEEMFSCLSDEEKEELLLLMEKLYSDWESRYRDHKPPHHAHPGHHHGCRKHHHPHDGFME